MSPEAVYNLRRTEGRSILSLNSDVSNFQDLRLATAVPVTSSRFQIKLE